MSENDYLEEKLSRARFLNALMGVVVFTVIAGAAWVVNDQRLLLGADSTEPEPASNSPERNVEYRLEAEKQKAIAERNVAEAVRQLAENQATKVLAEKDEALKVTQMAEVARRDSEKYRRMAEEHEQIAQEEARKAQTELKKTRMLNELLKKQLTIAEQRIKKLEARKAVSDQAFPTKPGSTDRPVASHAGQSRLLVGQLGNDSQNWLSVSGRSRWSGLGVFDTDRWSSRFNFALHDQRPQHVSPVELADEATVFKNRNSLATAVAEVAGDLIKQHLRAERHDRAADDGLDCLPRIGVEQP